MARVETPNDLKIHRNFGSSDFALALILTLACQLRRGAVAFQCFRLLVPERQSARLQRLLNPSTLLGAAVMCLAARLYHIRCRLLRAAEANSTMFQAATWWIDLPCGAAASWLVSCVVAGRSHLLPPVSSTSSWQLTLRWGSSTWLMRILLLSASFESPSDYGSGSALTGGGVGAVASAGTGGVEQSWGNKKEIDKHFGTCQSSN